MSFEVVKGDPRSKKFDPTTRYGSRAYLARTTKPWEPLPGTVRACWTDDETGESLSCIMPPMTAADCHRVIAEAHEREARERKPRKPHITREPT